MTVIYACTGCQTTFDPPAYQHHFEHDHCDHTPDGTPLAAILCDRHGSRCPLTDPTTRHAQYGPKGWPAKHQRECHPVYVHQGGAARTRPTDAAHHLDDCEPGCDQPHTAGWLTLGGSGETRQRTRAPRLPTAGELRSETS